MEPLVNLGNVYTEKNEDYRAIEFYLQALTINEQIPEDKKSFDPIINIGNIYYRRKEYDEAMQNISRLFSWKETQTVRLELLMPCIILAYLIMNWGIAVRQLPTWLKLKSWPKSVTASPLLTNIYGKLSEIYRDQGNYRKAYEYLTLHDELEDFFHSEQMARKLAEVEVSREFEKKEGRTKDPPYRKRAE